ncbi:serine hydrolase [Aurantiacibacter marinus]|uniref:serine hydrolase n=1 Tax=Aurantiacibacter marinus TaxID=874156 RepID=UPI00138DD139|nr:serine hydrolase [Aurantiacibacter marinus]
MAHAQDEQETAAPVSSQLAQRAENIIAAMREEMAYDAVFAQSFRDQVPEEQFRSINAQLQAQFGPLIGLETINPVSDNAAELNIRFERGRADTVIQLEPAEPNYVFGFLIRGVEPVNDTTQSVEEALAALPGNVSLLATRLDGSDPIISYNADTPLGLGSAFKLYVLSALNQSIAAGEHSWDDIVPLSQSSFPSGILQEWPEGSPVTLHTLATLMISISDNTATDQLIAVLGRDAIEAEIAASGHSDPARMQPFMNTRELFVLKSGGPEGIDGFRDAAPDDRRRLLEALGTMIPSENDIMAAFSNGPNAIDIEWFASANDIAAIFERLRSTQDRIALGIMGVNPAVPDSELTHWDYVGFKGGSEPGVLNFSYLLQDTEGNWSVVTMGWNNPDAEVDQQQFNLIAMRAIALVR